MKTVRFILSLVALSLTIAAAVCAVIAYWDKLTGLVELAREKFASLKPAAACVECDDFVE